VSRGPTAKLRFPDQEQRSWWEAGVGEKDAPQELTRGDSEAEQNVTDEIFFFTSSILLLPVYPPGEHRSILNGVFSGGYSQW